MTIEEMKAELEAAGAALKDPPYEPFYVVFQSGVQVSDWGYGEVIQKAYTHLQRERQFETMKVFIEKVSELYRWDCPEGIVEGARELLEGMGES